MQTHSFARADYINPHNGHTGEAGPPLTSVVRVVADSGASLAASWHRCQPWNNKLLEVHALEGETSVAVPLPLGLFILWALGRICGQATASSWLDAAWQERRSEIAVSADGSLVIAERGAIDRELVIDRDDVAALRVAVARLLLLSEKQIQVAGLLPHYRHAKPSEPCPVCGAEAPAVGSRSCLVAEGLAICRSERAGAIASIYGNKVPGHVHILGEPFSRVVVDARGR